MANLKKPIGELITKDQRRVVARESDNMAEIAKPMEGNEIRRVFVPDSFRGNERFWIPAFTGMTGEFDDTP